MNKRLIPSPPCLRFSNTSVLSATGTRVVDIRDSLPRAPLLLLSLDAEATERRRHRDSCGEMRLRALPVGIAPAAAKRPSEASAKSGGGGGTGTVRERKRTASRRVCGGKRPRHESRRFAHRHKAFLFQSTCIIANFRAKLFPFAQKISSPFAQNRPGPVPLTPVPMKPFKRGNLTRSDGGTEFLHAISIEADGRDSGHFSVAPSLRVRHPHLEAARAFAFARSEMTSSVFMMPQIVANHAVPLNQNNRIISTTYRQD